MPQPPVLFQEGSSLRKDASSVLRSSGGVRSLTSIRQQPLKPAALFRYRMSAPDHSDRNVLAGSIRIARQAGTRHASSDTPHKTTITPEYVTASRRETPNSIEAIAELATAAPRSPTTTPEPMSTAP